MKRHKSSGLRKTIFILLLIAYTQKSLPIIFFLFRFFFLFFPSSFCVAFVTLVIFYNIIRPLLLLLLYDTSSLFFFFYFFVFLFFPMFLPHIYMHITRASFCPILIRSSSVPRKMGTTSCRRRSCSCSILFGAEFDFVFLYFHCTDDGIFRIPGNHLEKSIIIFSEIQKKPSILCFAIE